MSSPNLTLRGYRRSDLPALFALDLLCFDEPFRFSRAAMRQFAESPNAKVVVAESGGMLVGFCIVHIERFEQESVGYITTLDVHPDLRRRGVAPQLIGEAEQQAREAGCGAMLLHVFSGNKEAIRFYERRGYLQVGAHEGFYGMDADALIYRKAFKVS